MTLKRELCVLWSMALCACASASAPSGDRAGAHSDDRVPPASQGAAAAEPPRIAVLPSEFPKYEDWLSPLPPVFFTDAGIELGSPCAEAERVRDDWTGQVEGIGAHKTVDFADGGWISFSFGCNDGVVDELGLAGPLPAAEASRDFGEQNGLRGEVLDEHLVFFVYERGFRISLARNSTGLDIRWHRAVSFQQVFGDPGEANFGFEPPGGYRGMTLAELQRAYTGPGKLTQLQPNAWGVAMGYMSGNDGGTFLYFRLRDGRVVEAALRMSPWGEPGEQFKGQVRKLLTAKYGPDRRPGFWDRDGEQVYFPGDFLTIGDPCLGCGPPAHQ